MQTLSEMLESMTTADIFNNYVYPYFNGGGPLYRVALEEIENRINKLEKL